MVRWEPWQESWTAFFYRHGWSSSNPWQPERAVLYWAKTCRREFKNRFGVKRVQAKENLKEKRELSKEFECGFMRKKLRSWNFSFALFYASANVRNAIMGRTISGPCFSQIGWIKFSFINYYHVRAGGKLLDKAWRIKAKLCHHTQIKPVHKLRITYNPLVETLFTYNQIGPYFKTVPAVL